MRSPKDMRTIQIDITNACVHSCSNCTRFCGHHKKPFFMDWETFRRAVDSLVGFDKRIGIMGGEPTLHPQFEQFVRYVGEIYPSRVNLPSSQKPIKLENFIDYIRDRNFYLDETLNNRKGLGLFTSLCDKYYKHYELIQDVFSYQCINDHQNPSKHQPLLVSRKELGISDEEWIKIRDNCWIQNTWSATITPKGAFFCEVAGALDMLFNGPGGWPIESDWWKREPEKFGYQLQWCEICGGALLNEGRISNEEIDDISPLLFDKLKEVQSPKVKKGKINVLDMNKPNIYGESMPNTSNRYLSDYKKRVSENNDVLKIKQICTIIFCYSKQDVDLLGKKMNMFVNTFDLMIVATIDDTISDYLQESMSKYFNVKIIKSVLGEWGRTFNKAMYDIDDVDWIFITSVDAEIPLNFKSRINKMIMNPGTLYRFNISNLKDKVFFFNKKAYSLKSKGFDAISKCNSILEFIDIWDNKKQIMLQEDFDTIENPDLQQWYNFADNIQMGNKEKIYKCLDKISNDINNK